MQFASDDLIQTTYLNSKGEVKSVIHRATVEGCCWNGLQYVSGDVPDGTDLPCLCRVNLTKKTVRFGESEACICLACNQVKCVCGPK